jgi:hypothetical protein
VGGPAAHRVHLRGGNVKDCWISGSCRANRRVEDLSRKVTDEVHGLEPLRTCLPDVGCKIRRSIAHAPRLTALVTALESDDVLGVTVRFNTYRTVYYDDPKPTNESDQTAAVAHALHKKLKAGRFQPNPARSLTIGVLGLWRRGGRRDPPILAIVAPVHSGCTSTAGPRPIALEVHDRA